jgi:hypothetical protein
MLIRRPADFSLVLVLCLAFVTATGAARPVKEPLSRGRHPHSVLTPRHGHAPRLGARTSGRHQPGLICAAIPEPPALESRLGTAKAGMAPGRRLNRMEARGPPARNAMNPPFLLAFSPHLDAQAQAVPQPDIPVVSRLTVSHSLVPEFPCTMERLAGRDRAGSVEGAPARRILSLTGGNS